MLHHDQETESAIAALRRTGLHRCTAEQTEELPDSTSDMSEPTKAIVYAATLAVALLGMAAALFS